MDVEVTVNLGRMEQLTSVVSERLDAVCRESAFAAERDAKSNCRVDTGACRASIYTVNSRGSGYANAEAEATSLNPKAKMTGEATRKHSIEALVSVGVDYGVWLEFGTSRMKRSYPFLIPAIDAQRSVFLDACAAVMRP